MEHGSPFIAVSFLVLFCLLAALLPSPVVAQGRQRESDLERELEDVKARLKAVEDELRASRERDDREPEEATDDDGIAFTPFWDRRALETPGPMRGVYDKPFLASLWRQTYLGGYTEIEYHSFEDGILEIPQGFRMHRTNLFLFSEVSDRVRFGSEIEFETEFDGGEVNDDIEVNVEMAFVDWIIFEELKFRGGAILAPLGRVNVNHDGPVRELTDRPLVSTFVIPTTLTDVGVGAYGDFDLDPVILSYEAYVVNGFKVLDKDGELAVDITEVDKVLREGRPSRGGDINSSVASMGRLAAEIHQMLELGGSWHVGTYDEENDNILSIFAGDMAFVTEVESAEFSLEGEVAVANFERDTFARTAGVPDEFWGYYIQGALSGMPDILREGIPNIFDDEGARFSLVLRFDYVDLDGDRGEAIEPGINFRPVADTVFKFSYKFTQMSLGLRDVPGREDFDDDGFVASLSTYF